MNTTEMPPQGAAATMASCSSGDSTRIATCAINDDGAEKKKKAVLNCGAVIRPPADTKTNHYSQKELIDLTLAYTKQDIHQAINDSDYGPGKRKINDLLPKNTYTAWPLSPAQEARVMAMIEPSPSMLRSDSGESAASSSSTSSTSTDISCTYVKDTTPPSSTSVTAPQSQAAPSTLEIDDMDMTIFEGTAVSGAAVPDKPRTVTPENVPPTTSNSSTSCVVEESTSSTTSSLGQKCRPDIESGSFGNTQVLRSEPRGSNEIQAGPTHLLLPLHLQHKLDKNGPWKRKVMYAIVTNRLS